MTALYYILFGLLMIVAVLLILLILIQKGRGGGLSSAFGGGGGSTAFGAKTGDVLTLATSIIFGVFILLAVSLDLVVGSQYKSSAGPTVTNLPPAGPVTVNAPAGSGNAPTPSFNDNIKALGTTLPATQAVTAPGLPAISPSLGQVINRAATQTTGQATNALKAATQPAGNLLGK